MTSKETTLPASTVAIASALLFGASTPAAKYLLGTVNPQLLAGMLYLGSGLGLLVTLAIMAVFRKPPTIGMKLRGKNLLWLAGATVSGGIFAPILLMIGLSTTSSGSTSLLLNLEGVLTTLLAWFAFKENFDKRIVLGMVSILFGSIILSWHPNTSADFSIGSLAIVGACAFWALDNNLTRNIEDLDAMQTASIKGLVAGTVNCAIALFCGANIPCVRVASEAFLIGFLGYGLSLVLFIKALRVLGTARTGAYFSTAPFAGALLSLVFLHETISLSLMFAAALMAFGVWLHLTERHAHAHSHLPESHQHSHVHDEHHQHHHTDIEISVLPHNHKHEHQAVFHSHQHFPDSKHRHEHK